MHHVRFRDQAGYVRIGKWTEDSIEADTGNYSVNDVDVLPPTNPSKVVCIGLNYADHAEETRSPLPDRPKLFLKPPNSVAGHGDTVTLPAHKDRIDYEAELGVVIDRQCRYVDEADAMDVVRGFTCVNDVSNRDDQRVEQNWVRGKAFDNAAPIGPVVASPDEVPSDAEIRLRVNGEEKQHSTLDNLLFTVPELITEITQYMTLEEGDVISTGTPAGVGPLHDGDTVEVFVTGVGTLRHHVKTPE